MVQEREILTKSAEKELEALICHISQNNSHLLQVIKFNHKFRHQISFINSNRLTYLEILVNGQELSFQSYQDLQKSSHEKRYR